MGHYFFPFIMAVVANSIMILAVYYLRKIPYFSNLFSVWFMVALYLVCVLRMFLPIEFPGMQIVLRDSVIYNFIVESVAVRTENAGISLSVIAYVLLGIWLVGSIIFAAITVYTYQTKSNYYLANSDLTTDEERAVFKRISAEILGDYKRLEIKKTDAVSAIMVMGYFRKCILLPEKSYSADELEMILRHECTHIKNKDLWLKLLVHIYCCIFWWNPFSYLLKHDLGFTLEMRCDLSVAKDFTDQQKAAYFETLTANCCQKAKDNKDDRNYFFICSELSDSRKNKELVKRTRAIAKDPPNKVGQAVVNTLVSLALVAVFVVSYFFIWQPDFGIEVDEEDYELADGGIIVDGSNGYLVRQEDGSYLMYIEDFPPVLVTKEEFEQGLFTGYPILEN